MTFSLPKTFLVLGGCVVYLAGALHWGLREREQVLAEAQSLAECREAPAERGVAEAKRDSRPTQAEARPAPGKPSWAELRAQ